MYIMGYIRFYLMDYDIFHDVHIGRVYGIIILYIGGVSNGSTSRVRHARGS
jgi:hypothetical protein